MMEIYQDGLEPRVSISRCKVVLVQEKSQSWALGSQRIDQQVSSLYGG